MLLFGAFWPLKAMQCTPFFWPSVALHDLPILRELIKEYLPHLLLLLGGPLRQARDDDPARVRIHLLPQAAGEEHPWTGARSITQP